VLQAAQLVDMKGRQLTEARLTLGVGGRPHDSVIVAVDRTLHEPDALGAPDQLDDAVVAQQKMVGDVSDRRRAVVSRDGQQQLVLGGREPDGPGLPLRPPFEAAQRVPVTTRQRGRPPVSGARVTCTPVTSSSRCSASTRSVRRCSASHRSTIAADLIVVGKIAHGPLADFVLNETANHLVHRPPCPVAGASD
jgi:nucleotide-binding universal stress UspA family protein